MKLGARDGFGLAVLAAVAAGSAAAAGGILESELDGIRGERVVLLAMSSKPEGAVTIVQERRSEKYSFLNKKRYLVHTASTARAGTALTPDDPRDRARADRDADARRTPKRADSPFGLGGLRERLPGGAWRATVADGDRTVEVVADPPPIEHPSPWASALAAVALGAAVLVIARLRASSLAASLCGVVAASIALHVLLGRDFAEASRSATAYIDVPGAGEVPAVVLPVLGLRIWISVLSAAGLVLAAGALSERGLTLARTAYADRGAYAALAPAMIGLGVLVGLPFAYGIGLSFFEHVHGTFTFVGLDNFARILSPPDRPLFAPGSMLYALFVNVVWTASNVTLHLVLGLTLALLLQKRAAKLSKLYRVFLIIPWAVPAYLTALIWKSMFDPDVGAINQLIGLQGMSWMHQPVTAFLANLATNVWLGFPFMMVVCLGALTSIPKDLYEAADVDGASPAAQLFRITLPLLQPALLPAVILGSIWTFNRFEVIYLVSEGRPDGATDILVTEAYRWAFERGLAQGGAYGYAAAYSVVIFAVLLVYGWMTSRVARAAEEALR